MSFGFARRLILMGAILAVPVSGYGQEATLSGTVTDSTKGVLPGAAVTAVHEATGNIFETATDTTGAYRLPVRVGRYQITAQLPGFRSVTRSGLELLAGQTAIVNFELAVSALAETITVTGEAPLVDTTSSTLGGNIDPRQMQDLPINGRNWQDLVVLAPGNRLNAVSDVPSTGVGTFQLNVDGQQVTLTIGASDSFGQPRFSRDAIAEFEFISNRFDATEGRSSGVQVNAITKSGTNTPSGSFSGYFRDDDFNAADFVARRVLPYSDQQLSGTFGGPIRRDKVHIFGSYEYEREPQTAIYSTPYPRFNRELTDTRRETKGLVRLDVQFSPRTRLSVRGSNWKNLIPYSSGGSATATPESAQAYNRYTNQAMASITQVLSNRAVNEVKLGYAGFWWSRYSYVRWADNPAKAVWGDVGSPSISFRGFSVGDSSSTPQRVGQDTSQIRDDFTLSFNKGGRHNLKLGGEFLYTLQFFRVCSFCDGALDAQGGPIPANIQDLFPDLYDAGTWNLRALSPIVRRYSVGVGAYGEYARRPYYATWLQDDWALTPRLTLNLGLRYDVYWNAYMNSIALPPFLEANRPNDTNDWGPRVGLAYQLNDRTVLRGGFGKYFAETAGQQNVFTLRTVHFVTVQVENDGRPDFAVNPFNGPGPQSFDEGLLFLQERGFKRQATSLVMPNAETAYSYQTSVGIQRQLSTTTGVQADYVYTGIRADVLQRNVNLAYNPATGLNYPFSDISRRPYPEWGLVTQALPESYSNYHGLQLAFTKRLSQQWQASGTYTLSVLRDGTRSPAPFPVAPDLGGEYGPAVGDQRNRAVINAIWQTPFRVQLSGLYFYGSGDRFSTNWGGDFRDEGGRGSGRLRPNGTIVPRNSFVGKPIHRVDLRVQHRFPLIGRATIDGILEVFNVFNHANFGSYTTQQSSPNYGRPTRNLNVAYQPRMMQLGFRFAF